MTAFKPKVLVVDDELMLLEIFSFFVAEAGCEAVTASSVKDAIRILEQTQVALVLTDVVMPGTTGVDLLKWVKAYKPAIPVILISGYSMVSENQAFELGASAVLGKPVEGDRFIELIAKFAFPSPR